MIEQLLALLEARANTNGLVMVREVVFLNELATTSEALTATLTKLAQAGLIEVLTPGRFLVIKLRKWRGKESEPARNSPKTGAPAGRAYSYPKLLHKQHLNNSYRQEASVAAPMNDLLREILETLGETDAASFQKAVELYSPHVIRSALDRVRRAQGIRKSRTALFRHLLPRLAKSTSN